MMKDTRPIGDLSTFEIIKYLGKNTTPKFLHGMKEFVPGKTLIPYSGPYWNDREVVLALDAFLTGAWLTTGTNVFRFQSNFARKFNVKHAHMVNSGSSANLTLISALKKHLKWKDGDEIIVSPVGFPTTIAPIAQNNLKPVFVDIEWNTLNFAVRDIEAKINDRTVAIFVSPVLGNPPDMDYLKAIVVGVNEVRAIRHIAPMILIGDNCDSLGSVWDGKLITDYYYAWTTSFYPAHHMTTGEGGMVCSNDESLMKTVRSISWWGRACYCVGQANLLSCGTCNQRFSKWLENEGVDEVIDHKYVFENMGYNLKPLDLQGAIGLAQLEKWDDIERLRRENFTKLRQAIVIPSIKIANKLALADPSWFGVPIICANALVKEHLVDHLEDSKIQTRSYFAGNILAHPGYKHLGNKDEFPEANKALSHVFFIGCPPFYTDEIIKYIGEVFHGYGW